MVEEKEKDKIIEELKEKLAQSEKREKTTKRSGGFGDFIGKAQFYANVPKDPYAHQYMMIHKPSKELNHPSDLLTPDLLLSNIKDDRTMLLFQRDFYYLHRFFEMGKRSVAVKTVFEALFYPWEGQVRLTGAKAGAERGYQSFIEPEVETRGFGFARKKSQARKKKQLTDYLRPDEEQNVYE